MARALVQAQVLAQAAQLLVQLRGGGQRRGRVRRGPAWVRVRVRGRGRDRVRVKVRATR